MVKSKQYGQHRFLEIIPGALVWATIIFAIIFSFVWPLGVIVFVIVFDLYWLFRVVYFVLYLIFSWKTYRKSIKTDWNKKLESIDGWRKIYHVVFLPTYKESHEILRIALKSIDKAKYPNDRIIVVIGGEERDHGHFQISARRIKKEFGRSFHKLIITEHPKDLPNEIPGKGSNLNYMAHQVRPVIDDLKIPYKNIIVSSFDVDTMAHPAYFAALSYTYLTNPNPTHSSYQPVTLLSNNIWQTTAPVRIASFGTAFWLLTELSRHERMWTFSSHSMPWQMLVDVGYWEKDMVSEDSRIFLQALLHYHGDYKVTPIFLPVHMDAVEGESYLGSLIALYKQQRRWAWGVEHFAYMVPRFRNDPLIPLKIKLKYTFFHLEGMYTWSTAPILIFILGYLPLWVSSEASQAIITATPFTLEWILRFAMIGVFTSGILSLTMLPKRPKTVKKWAWLVMVIQWALLPITFVLFGSFPAIDAQTRMMFGKYLGFNVTKKKR